LGEWRLLLGRDPTNVDDGVFIDNWVQLIRLRMVG